MILDAKTYIINITTAREMFTILTIFKANHLTFCVTKINFHNVIIKKYINRHFYTA